MDEGNSLAFFTANHSKHDSLWRMTGESISVVCVACLVELLETSDARHIRKRKALREVIFLLSRDHKLSDLLSQNTKVAIHLCGILIELLATNNDLLTDAAIEGLVIVATKHCSENQMVEIVEKLESTIIELNNVRKSHPYVAVLGRLLNSTPALSRIAATNSVFLDYVVSNVSLFEDKIQLALVFLVLQICASNICLEGLNLQIKQRICKEICAVLCSSSNSEVQTNSLGVLKCFSKHRDVLNCVLLTPSLAKGNCSMLEGLKKLLLSSHVAIQAGGIQCISEILRNDSQDSTYTSAFLKSGIGEMLLEDLETSSDIILGSAFCCLDRIVRSEIFYSDGYAAYGIESFILGVSNSIKFRNPEIIRQGFRVVSMVLASQTKGVPLFSNEGLYKHCAMVLHQGLKSADYRVLVQAGSAVEHFLRPVYLPLSASFDAIIPLFKTVIAQIQKFIKPEELLRKIPKDLAEELMGALLRVTDKTFTFVEEYQGRKPSYEVLLTQTSASVSNTNESVDQFVQLLWQAIDQACVPALMTNYESIENPEVFHSFFVVLLRSIAPESDHRRSFAKKLASGSFVRLSLDIKDRFCRSELNKDLKAVISGFLVELCLALRSDADSETGNKTFLTPSSSCLINSVSACLALLEQSSVQQNTNQVIDGDLFDTQCFAIELLYVSFAHEAEFVRTQDLVVSLCKYLVFHPDLYALPHVTLRNLLYLWVTCFERCTAIPLPTASSERIRDAQEIVVQGLLKLSAEEFKAIDIPNPHFIGWLFHQEPLAHMFGRDALLCFLRTEAAQKHSDCQTLLRLLMTNLTSFRTLISLIAEDEEAVVNHVSKTSKALMSAVSYDLPELRSMSSYVGEILHKLFVRNKTKPLQQHSTSAMLELLIAFQTKLPAFNQDIKLLYHVVNLLNSTTPGGSRRVAVSAFNYLNTILAWNMRGKDPGIAVLLLSSKAFCSCIQDVLNTFLVRSIAHRRHPTSEVSLLASVLVLIAYLVLFQRHMSKDVDDTITVNKIITINLVNQHHNALGLASLVFWDAVFRTTLQEKTSLVVFSDNAPGSEELPVKLSETDHQLFFIYLQNCMVHDSETVRQCAVKCFQSFLNYVTDAGPYASNPWNRIVLESQLGVLSLDVITSSLVQLCVLILRCAPGDLQFSDALKSTLDAIVSRIPTIPSSEEELSWHCLALLEQVQSCADHRLSAQQTNGALVWLKTFQDSLSTELSSSPEHARSIEFCSVGDLIVAKNLLVATVPRDHEVLSKLLFQLEEGSKEYSLEQRDE